MHPEREINESLCSSGEIDVLARQFLDAEYLICLGTFCALDDIELYFITLFEAFVTIPLDRGVVNEDIGSSVTAKEAISLCVIEPLHGAFVLCQDPCSLRSIQPERPVGADTPDNRFGRKSGRGGFLQKLPMAL